MAVSVCRAALTETGVTRWLSDALQIMHGVPVWLVVVGGVVIITAASEIMSNSATITAFFLIPAIKDFDPLTPPAWALPKN